jgi:hypothetical protein
MRLQPFPNVFGKFDQVVHPLQVRITLIPVNAQVFVNKNITEARDGCQFPGELRRKHSQFTHAQECLVVVAGLQRLLDRNDPIADIEAALGGDLQVAFNNIPQIGIRVELRARLRAYP